MEGKIAGQHVDMRVIGCGDAFGSGGRFQSCYLLDDGSGRMALEFGATSLSALHKLNIDPDSIALVVVSHMHADHAGGLPLLLLHRAYISKAKPALVIAGPAGIEREVHRLVEAMYPGTWHHYWEFSLTFVELSPGKWLQLMGRKLAAYPVRHFAGDAASVGLRIETGGKILGYSGDTGWSDELVAIAEGTDLFVCECNTYEKGGFPEHLSYEELLSRRSAFHTRRLVLTHLGPDMIAHLDDVELETAHDDMMIRL